MKLLSRVLTTSSVALLCLGAVSASAVPVKTAQSSDINVNGPTVNCDDVKVSSPGVGVSVPNVSRLVPNVGKLLREGVGVPAPDTEAPDISVPKVSVSAPAQTCADARNQDNEAPAGTMSNSEPVRGLW